MRCNEVSYGSADECHILTFPTAAVCRIASPLEVCVRRPRCPPPTIMGPASANLHTSGHSPSFDHFVGLGKQRRGDGKPERFGCLEIDHQFEFRRLYDRQVGGLFALENSAGVDAGLAVSLSDVGPVAYQYPGGDMLSPRRYRGHCMAFR